MTGALEFTILGCGSSAGVPRADGNWGVCDPADPRNSRSRCSLLVRRSSPDGAEQETTVLVDTSPGPSTCRSSVSTSAGQPAALARSISRPMKSRSRIQ